LSKLGLLGEALCGAFHARAKTGCVPHIVAVKAAIWRWGEAMLKGMIATTGSSLLCLLFAGCATLPDVTYKYYLRSFKIAAAAEGSESRLDRGIPPAATEGPVARSIVEDTGLADPGKGLRWP